MMQHQRMASPRHNLLKTRKTSLSPSGCMSPISPSGSGIRTSDKCLVNLVKSYMLKLFLMSEAQRDLVS
uniref:Macaca fascicularis brain cDNA clone: QflA-18177, similar to human ataxin 2-binding protein 1 (A2BP1), transcript variant4, mRNA, RefSeq: NM_018723.2 n=1 Tax=Macaca fascicularis TaxID=9541 RepID=I7GC37_MACFA|nr:unnamed protein product [Macaca fascicularis]